MNNLCLLCIFQSKVKIPHTSFCDTRDTIRKTHFCVCFISACACVRACVRVCVCVFKRPERKKQFGFGSALTSDEKQTEEEKRGESEEEGEEGDRRKQQTEGERGKNTE